MRCVGQKGNQPRRKRSNQSKDAFSCGNIVSTAPVATCTELFKHENHFILKSLHGTQIRVCYGCKQRIRYPPSVPPLPFDFVLAAKLLYSFSHPKTGNVVVKKDWKHFHFSQRCIKDHQLNLHIGNLIKPKLSQVHWDKLKNDFSDL